MDRKEPRPFFLIHFPDLNEGAILPYVIPSELQASN